MIKNILIAVLAAICLVLIGINLRTPDDAKPEIVKEAKDLVNAEVERVTKKIDQKGFEHAVIDEVENVVNGRSQLTDSAKILLDSATKLLTIKDRQIEQLITVNATLKAENLQAIKTEKGFSYQDRWTKIDFFSPKDSADTGRFNFSYNADLNHAEYWKRKWFLAPKKHYIDFWISDTRATINGVKRIKFAAKEPFIKSKLNAVSFYNGVDNRIYFGGNAEIEMGRVGLSGSYLYSPVEDRWYPFFSGKYRLLNF